MQIIAALFIDDFQLVPPSTPGGPTKLNITGAHFSEVAPEPVPVTVAPHLVVLVRCPPEEPGTGTLEVVFRKDDDQVARNVQPLKVEPGKFSYRLVRAELSLDDYGTVLAECRIDDGEVVVVPWTLLPPAESG